MIGKDGPGLRSTTPVFKIVCLQEFGQMTPAITFGRRCRPVLFRSTHTQLVP